ncbi:MAG TPA: AP2/ERF family transcription factor [Pirellulales bacterium]|nr:AP2/ERF family transcription factor [Pirellulales bacterium]
MSAPTDVEVVRVPLGTIDTALVEPADWERPESFAEFRDGFVWIGRLSSLRWRAAVKKYTTYAVHVLPGNRMLRIHRAVMGARAAQIIDHFDGNGRHNWRRNLRATTYSGNAANRRPLHGSTRFKGVAWHRGSGKFEAYVRHRGRKRHLGLFETAEEAAHAYDVAAVAIWGEMARPNFALLAQQHLFVNEPSTTAPAAYTT